VRATPFIEETQIENTPTVRIPETPPPTTNPITQPTTVGSTPPPTIPQSTPQTAESTPTPVTVTVPVTVLVYPSGPIYSPGYYYPYGYGFPPSSNYYSTGTLTVTSNPSGATVLIDGYNQEITPWIYTNLATGYHTVEVDYPGYESYVTNVYIDNGNSMEVDAQLTPLLTYGSLFVQTTPEGADVFVDGNYEGTSPVTVSALSDGPHQLELHLAGYAVITQTESVVAGQGTTVNLAFSPYSSSSSEGSVSITSNINGALVYLDGIYKGAIRSGTPFSVIAVSPGSHDVLLHMPGYNDYTSTVQVNAGQIAYVNADFTAASQAGISQSSPPQTGTGSITATSSPAGGQVFLDNQFRGVAPVTIYYVPVGNHIINMKLAGYSDWSGSIQVQPGQGSSIQAEFAPGVPSTSPTRASIPITIIFTALAAGVMVVRSGKR
jgi:hypothetical protein